jgi:hypothetical protein
MPERVFVSAATVKCPGVSEIADLAELLSGRKEPPLQRFQLAGDEVLLGEDVPLDRGSPFYPPRRNQKVMRQEVIAATMGVCELLERAEVPAAAKADIPLFVASGLSLERQAGDLDWFSKAFRATLESSSSGERNKRLGQLAPPLLALRTLTNATSSFIAEQTGVAGNNTTFGNTSISGFYALKEGFDAVVSGQCSLALVGAASRGGVASYFMYRNFFADARGWRESLATAFLLLESETSLHERGVRPLCELTVLRTAPRPPSLTRPDEEIPFGAFADDASGASLALYSGAFCRSEHQRFGEAVATWWPRAESLFESLGNTGPANVFLGILAGLARAEQPGPLDCLDRDPYARECLVRTEQVPP